MGITGFQSYYVMQNRIRNKMWEPPFCNFKNGIGTRYDSHINR